MAQGRQALADTRSRRAGDGEAHPGCPRVGARGSRRARRRREDGRGTSRRHDEAEHPRALPLGDPRGIRVAGRSAAGAGARRHSLGRERPVRRAGIRTSPGEPYARALRAVRGLLALVAARAGGRGGQRARGPLAMIAAVVLAAGLARRMGRQKLLLQLSGKPVVRWSVEHVAGHVEDVVIVTGPDDAALRQALEGLAVRFAVNPRPQDGQGTSIAAGVTALKPWTTAALIALGDQPRMPAAVVPALLDAFRRSGKAIVAPVYQGVHGTPVLFSSEVFGELRALTGDAGARAIVKDDPERVETVT